MALCSPILAAFLLAAPVLAAQTGAPQTLDPVATFHFRSDDPLTLRQPALPNHPFTVTGRSGAILGMQDGTTELWQLPTKLFSGLHLRAEVEGYPVPIELNPLAAELEVAPDHTTLTYAHAAITVKQHMFVPAGNGNEGLGGQIVFEVHAIHPATLVVSLTPALIQMWPAPQWGTPGWDWRPLGSGGAYTIGTDNPAIFGMIGMPDATPGSISPYQEHPRTLPMEFRVHVDPARGDAQVFPLLCELSQPGETNSGDSMTRLADRLTATARALPEIYERTAEFYAHFFDRRTVPHTPDPQLDRALQWAELAIDKAQATIPAHNGQPAETGLVAGWYPSFDSARPGFGWFFGRDTLWSMYAIDSYGDGTLAREAFNFLIRRQRADGKMPHEFSQTAESLTGDMAWKNLPYEYAAADSTPLFLLALRDYVRSTGDLAFVRQHWAAVQKAYMFESTHDSDGDGVYDNAQGTGWVEGWPPKLPHQELYLASLDEEASRAYAQLAAEIGEPAEAAPALQRAAHVAAVVSSYRQPNGLYAFSKNADGTFDPTRTIYPSVGLWWHAKGLPQPDPMLDAWAGEHFETDWGTRALADDDPTYDPISYHQGTVWPLFTGWNSMAQYRAGRPLAGLHELQANAGLTYAQDPGAVTEVLSGRFYEPLGRSSTHQLWSSAMVLVPALRELFGLEPDAPAHTLLVHPHLPPDWNEATLEHVHVGSDEFTVHYRREGPLLHVVATSAEPSTLCLRAEPELPVGAATKGCITAAVHTLNINLPPVELSLAAPALPLPGAETTVPHILAEHYGPHQAECTVEAPAGSTVLLHVRRNGNTASNLRADGAQLEDEILSVRLPAGQGWKQQLVRLSW